MIKYIISILLLGLLSQSAFAVVASSNLTIGAKVNSNKSVTFNRNATNRPQIRWNETAGAIQFSNDGSTFFSIPNSTPNSQVTSVAGTYSVQLTDDVVLANASTGTATMTLPASSGNSGKKIIFEKIDSTSNSVILSGTVDGITNPTMTTPLQTMTIISDGTVWRSIGQARHTPTVTIFSSGSGTYTPPNGVSYFIIDAVGGGGGGSGNSNGGTSPTGGTATTFGGFLSAGGASANGGNGESAAGAGGTNTLTTSATVSQILNITGGRGTEFSASAYSYNRLSGGVGCVGPWGSGGAGGLSNGSAAYAGSYGSGGGGQGINSGSIVAGTGGSCGGYVRALVVNPAGSTYAYSVGSGGVGGQSGAGGSGGSGYIFIMEYY